MWFKATDGKYYNLAQALSIEIFDIEKAERSDPHELGPVRHTDTGQPYYGEMEGPVEVRADIPGTGLKYVVLFCENNAADARLELERILGLAMDKEDEEDES